MAYTPKGKVFHLFYKIRCMNNDGNIRLAHYIFSYTCPKKNTYIACPALPQLVKLMPGSNLTFINQKVDFHTASVFNTHPASDLKPALPSSDMSLQLLFTDKTAFLLKKNT